MPNSELISEFFDLAAVKNEFGTVKSELASLYAQLQKLNQTKITLQGASGASGISSASKAATDELTKFEAGTARVTTALKEQASMQERLAQARKQEHERQMQRIKEEESAQQKLTKAEEDRASSSSYTNKGAQPQPKAQPKGVTSFIPQGELEQQIQYLQKNKAALADNQAGQKALAKSLKDGAITQAEYNRQINVAIQKELEFKQSIQGNTAAIKQLQQAETLEEGSLAAMRIQLAALIKEYDQLSATQRASAAGVGKMTAISNLTTEVLTLEKTTGRAQRDVGNYGNAMTKAFSSAFGLVRQLAYILPGLGIAGILGLIIDPIVAFVGKLFEAKGAIEQIKGAMDGAKGSFTDAAANVARLRVDIDLAKQGFIDKEKVVKDYNETIGKTTGKVTDLEAAEKALQKNADAYIKFTLLKATATQAFQKASEKLFEASVKAIEPDKKNASFLDNITSLFGQDFDTPEARKAYEDKLKKAGNARKNAAVSTLNKEKNDFLTIAKRFEMEAAAISKQFDFNFSGDKDKPDKAEKQGVRLRNVSKKFFEDQLKDRIAALKEVSKSEDFFESDRLNRRKEANELEKLLLKESTQAQLNAERDKLKTVINDPKASHNAIINAQREYAVRVAEINERSAYESKKIEEDLGNDLLTIRNKAHAKELADERKQLDEMAKVAEERDKAAITAEVNSRKARLDARQNSILQDRDIQLAALEDQLSRREITQKQYDKKRLLIETESNGFLLQADLDFTRDLIASAKARGENTVKAEADLAAIELKIAENKNKGKLKLDKDYIKERNNMYKELANEVANLAIAVVEGSYDREKNALQDLIDKGQEKKQKDIEAVNATTASNEDKAAKIAVINARADAQETSLKTKQRRLDYDKAVFDRGVTIAKIVANTAERVIALFPSPLAAIAGAIGAVQIATVLATPIPKFKHGKRSDYEGAAYVGDGGKAELIERADGRLEITPAKDTLTFIGRKDIVHPDANQYLNVKRAELGLARERGLDTSKLERKLDSVRAAIEGKPTPHLRRDWKGDIYTGYSNAQRSWEWKNRLTQS